MNAHHPPRFDDRQPWSQIPEAAAILLDCAANPPAMVRKATGTGFKFDPSDLRMVVLESIRDRFFREVVNPLHQEFCAGTGTLSRDEILDLWPTVDEAIDAVPEAVAHDSFAVAAE